MQFLFPEIKYLNTLKNSKQHSKNFLRMKTSDNSILTSTISALLIGPPGGGKTTFALQWPGVWVADCDQNLAGPTRLLKTQNIYKPYFLDLIAYDDDNNVITDLAKQWDRLLRKTDEAIKSPEVKTLFLDSLTHIDRILYAWCCVKLNVKDLEWNQFNLFKNTLYRYIMAVRASGKNLLVACHEKIEYDAKGNVKKYVPVLSTNLAQYFGYMFTDIWRFLIVDQGANKFEAMMYTLPTTTSDLKNSLQLPAKLKARYSEVETYITKLKIWHSRVNGS